MKEKLQELIKKTNYIYDLEDALEWMLYNKKELIKILQEDEENEMGEFK